MGLLLTLIAGLVVWIVLWATGVKGFDAFMITILMLIVAGAAHVLMQFMPGRQRSRD
jgi:Mn2+/Fe2+ NRAMP family transporter